MRISNADPRHIRQPQLIDKTLELDNYLKKLSIAEIAQQMNLSKKLATATHQRIANWGTSTIHPAQTIDAFLGDIYSGLQSSLWSAEDRRYADANLYILSGMYGTLRPLDTIYPYRLELGYKLAPKPYKNLYDFWGDSAAACLPATGPIINLCSVEYSKLITPYVDSSRIISPSFLSVNPKSGEPTNVTVHSKIARGAFAGWMMKNRIESVDDLKKFDSIGYRYDPAGSTDAQPAFVCQKFQGIGLSVRLT